MKLAVILGLTAIGGYILIRELRHEAHLRKQQNLGIKIRQAHLAEVVELYAEIIWEEE